MIETRIKTDMRLALPLKNILICTVASFAFFLTGVTLPLLALPVMLFFIFPTLSLSYEHGTFPALFSALFTSLLLNIFFHPLFSLTYFLSFGLSGVLLGFVARKMASPGDMILVSVAISLLCKLTAVYLVFKLTGTNFLMPDAAQIENALIIFTESNFASLAGNNIQAIKENLSQSVQYLVMLIPYSVIFFSTAEVLVSFWSASFIHRKITGDSFFLLPSFSEWAFPKNILLVLLIGFLCDLAASNNPDMAVLRQVGANLNAVSRTLFIVQGLAVTCFFLKLRGFSKFLRVAIIIATPIITLLGDIFSIVGIIDLGFNLRKRIKGETQ